MPARDRFMSSFLFASAALSWVAVAILFANVSPTGAPMVQLAGALLLGAAVALSSWPILWLLVYARGHSSSPGDWARAGRRAGLVGLAVAILVVLRSLGTFSLPMAIFVVAMAVLVEVAFLLRR